MALHKSEHFVADCNPAITELGALTLKEDAAGTATVRLYTNSLADPAPAPTAARIANTDGLVNEGAHSYKVTFVDANGESEPSAAAAVTAYGIGAPAAPVAANANLVGIVEPGDHSYKLTYVTSSGETSPSPKSNVITVGIDPPAAPVATDAEGFGLVEAGTHSYKTVFTDGANKSAPSAVSNVVTAHAPVAPTACTATLASDATSDQIEAGSHSYKVVFYATSGGASAASVISNAVTNDGSHTSNDLSDIPLGPPGTTGRKLYRNTVGAQTTWKLLTTIANNSATTYTDTTPDATVAAAAEPVAATTTGRVSVSSIQVGPTGVTSRELYRRVAGDTGAWKLVAADTVNDNSGTTYSDAIADSGLGADAPMFNTIPGKVDLTTIVPGPAGVTDYKVYGTDAGDTGTYKLKATITDEAAVSYAGISVADATGASAPSANTTHGQVRLTALPVSLTGDGVTRKVYRTAAAADPAVNANYKLLGTVSDNLPNSTYTDNLADATVAGNASPPTTDTSGDLQFEFPLVANEFLHMSWEHPIVARNGTWQVEVVDGTVSGTICGR